MDDLSNDSCLDDNANSNPFFRNPVIRAFLFSNTDSLLSDLSLTSSMQSTHSHSHPLDLLLDSSEPLVETAIDSPLDLSPGLPEAPIASCDDDEDLGSVAVSCAVDS